jgi:DNA polymerase I
MSNVKERLFLIDGFALAYRSFYAFQKRPLINSKGQNTSAIYGFTTVLLRILDTESPDHIAVVLDSKEPTFRHKIFKKYKATREKMPEDLASQIDMLKQVIAAFNIPVVELPGYEADDIIGTLATLAEREGVETYMVTGDKDYMQLVNDVIRMYKPGKAGAEPEVIDRSAVIDKFGVPPERVIDVLALMGDSSDNIPGVPGIGEKTAIPLIQKHGTLENLLDHVDLIEKKSLQSKLAENREIALLSKKLVTIDRNTPVTVSFHELNRKEPNREMLSGLLVELEFKSIIEQLNLEPALYSDSAGTMQTIDSKKIDYRAVRTEKDLKQMIEELDTADRFVFDTETTSVDPLNAAVVGISISAKPGKAWFISLDTGNRIREKCLAKIKVLLGNPDRWKGGQNVKYDILALRSLGIRCAPPYFDTMIASYLLQPDRQHNLDSLAREYLNYSMISYSYLVGSGKNQMDIRDVELNELVRYSCEDADITLQLWSMLEKELSHAAMDKLSNDIEFPLVDVLAEIEANGVTVDTGFLLQLSKSITHDLISIREQIYGHAGLDFNINSTQQLSKVLFERLQLPPVKKTKTGYSTDTSVLEQLKNAHPIIRLLLEYRQLTKLQSTYIDALPRLINLKTGKVHTSFNQTVAATGRLSSSNPNLQNIPIRTELGRSIRKAFIASGPDYILMSSDYSQIELRIMAHISGDEGLLEAFHNREDIHATTAAKVFGVAHADVTPDMRRKAKEINFGIMYGIGAFGLSNRLEIPQQEAKEIIDRYFERFPKVLEYIVQTKQKAYEYGYVSTIYGRRRYLPDIRSHNRTIRQNAERQAINMPIQGTAADMIKLAMVHIHRKMRQRKMKSKMILQVHDELVFEVHSDEIKEMKKIVEGGMTRALDLEVPIEVDTGFGKNWFEAH